MTRFELDLTKAVEKAKGRVGVVLRKTALELFTQIVRKTPVDTGRARGNWTAGIGTLPAGTDAPDKKGGATIAQAAAVIATAEPDGPAIYIGNNTPYILRLEIGPPKPTSKQAPAGMVRVSIENLGGIVREAVQEAKND